MKPGFNRNRISISLKITKHPKTSAQSETADVFGIGSTGQPKRLRFPWRCCRGDKAAEGLAVGCDFSANRRTGSKCVNAFFEEIWHTSRIVFWCLLYIIFGSVINLFGTRQKSTMPLENMTVFPIFSYLANNMMAGSVLTLFDHPMLSWANNRQDSSTWTTHFQADIASNKVPFQKETRLPTTFIQVSLFSCFRCDLG